VRAHDQWSSTQDMVSSQRLAPVELLASGGQLRLLGGFELSLGTQIVAIPRNAQRLIAFLALQKRPLSRSYVASVLWMDSPTTRAAANLRCTLFRLPRPSLVQTTSSMLRVAPDIRVDVADLTRLAHDLLEPLTDCSSLALGASAIALLSDDLLPDWDDGDWVVVERERLRQLRLHALEAMAARLIDLGRHGQAVEAALLAVSTEPLQESAHGALIRAHLLGGNHGRALRQYQQYRRLLADELGVEPSRALAALVEPLTVPGWDSRG
jgi:DNA-binding SARP family transcriptional activator